jgi:hypothetical protein
VAKDNAIPVTDAFLIADHSGHRPGSMMIRVDSAKPCHPLQVRFSLRPSKSGRPFRARRPRVHLRVANEPDHHCEVSLVSGPPAPPPLIPRHSTCVRFRAFYPLRSRDYPSAWRLHGCRERQNAINNPRPWLTRSCRLEPLRYCYRSVITPTATEGSTIGIALSLWPLALLLIDRAISPTAT